MFFGALTLRTAKSCSSGGGCWTMTLNEQVFVLPDVSIAVQTTGVVPRSKVEPLAGTHSLNAIPQLSVALTVKFTTVLLTPASTFVAMFPQLMFGLVVSRTVMVASQESEAPMSSTTVKETPVTPFGYGPAG